MIIPKHRVCDICDQAIGYNMRYYVIKSKDLLVGSGGSIRDNRNHDICEDCMCKIAKIITNKEACEWLKMDTTES